MNLPDDVAPNHANFVGEPECDDCGSDPCVCDAYNETDAADDAADLANDNAGLD